MHNFGCGCFKWEVDVPTNVDSLLLQAQIHLSAHFWNIWELDGLKPCQDGIGQWHDTDLKTALQERHGWRNWGLMKDKKVKALPESLQLILNRAPVTVTEFHGNASNIFISNLKCQAAGDNVRKTLGIPKVNRSHILLENMKVRSEYSQTISPMSFLTRITNWSIYSVLSSLGTHITSMANDLNIISFWKQ